MLVARTILAAVNCILVIGPARAESKHRPRSQQPYNPQALTPHSHPHPINAEPIKYAYGKSSPSEAPERRPRRKSTRGPKSGVDKKLADETQRLANETQALASYTGDLAIVTLFLFCAAVVQIGRFVWQLR